jgi:hypothetical protein
MKTDRLKLWILALLMLAIVFIIVNPVKAQSDQARYHQKLQKYHSFERWEKEQHKVRIKAVKSAVKQSKEAQSRANQYARLVRKENRIRKSIIK